MTSRHLAFELLVHTNSSWRSRNRAAFELSPTGGLNAPLKQETIAAYDGSMRLPSFD